MDPHIIKAVKKSTLLSFDHKNKPKAACGLGWLRDVKWFYKNTTAKMSLKEIEMLVKKIRIA